MVDLRSDEERQIAPSNVYGVPYLAKEIGVTAVDLAALRAAYLE